MARTKGALEAAHSRCSNKTSAVRSIQAALSAPSDEGSMRYQPSVRRTSLQMPLPLACCHSRVHERALLGLGFGDRFEALRAGSGSFKGRMLHAEKAADFQGKRLTRRGLRITWQRGEASMVRRGSTVRVRQRALKSCKSRFLVVCAESRVRRVSLRPVRRRPFAGHSQRAWPPKLSGCGPQRSHPGRAREASE